jgi:hypothetical protein
MVYDTDVDTKRLPFEDLQRGWEMFVAVEMFFH